MSRRRGRSSTNVEGTAAPTAKQRTDVPLSKEEANHRAVSAGFVEANLKDEAFMKKERDRQMYRKKFLECIVQTEEYKKRKAEIDPLLAATKKRGRDDVNHTRENAKRELEEMFPELLASLDPEQQPVPAKAKGNRKLPEGFKYPACSPQDLAVSDDVIIFRMNELLKGNLDYLRYNIQFVDDDMPLYLAFLIVGLPLATMNDMVIGYGDEKYTRFFNEHAELISRKDVNKKDKSTAQPNISEKDLKDLKSEYEKHKEEIGQPKWVSNKQSLYMMDSWFMGKPRKNCAPPCDPKFHINDAENTGKSVAFGAHHMDKSLRIAVLSILHIAKEALCLVLKASVTKYFEGATPEFYANHGLVRTGNHVIRQILHGDDDYVFTKPLFVKLLNGEEITAQDLIDAGYVIDLPLSEEGRPLQLVIPMFEEQKFVFDVLLTPYGSMLVRNIAVAHGGHGGGCGNAVFHAILVERGKTQEFITKKLDDFEEHLPRNGEEITKPTERHFNGWSSEWRTEDGEPLKPENWMAHASDSLKERGRQYAKSLFKVYKKDKESLMGMPRWLLSPMKKIEKKKDDSETDKEQEA